VPAVLAVALLSACGGGDEGEEARERTPGQNADGGDGDDGSSAPGAPAPEVVQWMGDFCEAKKLLIDMPFPPETNVPSTEADRRPLLDFLGETSSVLTDADEAAAALPPPPPGTAAAGNELVDSYRDDLDELLSKMDEYTADAVVFPAEDLDSVRVLSGVDVVTFSPGGEGMSDYLRGHPDLAAAYDDATACPS
jgi:hypothetical protein